MTELTIQERIAIFEKEIYRTNNKDRKKSMKLKLEALKAELSGKHVTEEHLKELKPLIIFIAKKSLYYNSRENLIAVMTQLLNDCNENKVHYKTVRGTKGVVVARVQCLSKKLSNEIYFQKNPDALSNQNILAYDPEYLSMQQFHLGLH